MCLDRRKMPKNQGKSSKSRSDTAVQGTNDNSIVSKHSMANLGYFQDDFLQYVVAKKQRRAPLINRGYYIRAKAINYMLTTYLQKSQGQQKQILSLGAGFDTAYFRLKSEGLLEGCVFVEIDFPDVVRRKAALIHHQAKLRELIEEDGPVENNSPIVINTPGYKLLGVDLTDLQTLQACMKACHINPSTPTALLSECVITYMSTKNSSKLIQWSSDYFENAVFITYEQILPDDAFGTVMRAHFKKIGSPLKGILTYPSVEAQETRYCSLGWTQCTTLDMNDFNNSLPTVERRRVAGLEPFDEFEEWHLKCAHYIVLVAEKGECEGFYKTAGAFCDKHPSPSSDTRSLRLDAPLLAGQGCVIQRVGHSCTTVGNLAVVVGGFGSSDGKHGRMKDITVLDVQTGKVLSVMLDDESRLLDERMFHSACLIGKETVLIFGGRTSPTKGLATGFLLTLFPKLSSNLEMLKIDETSDPHSENLNSFQSVSTNAKTDVGNCEAGSEVEQTFESLNSEENTGGTCENKHCDLQTAGSIVSNSNCNPSVVVSSRPNDDVRSVCVKCQELRMTGDIPSPRWRHTTTNVKISGNEKVLLFGGCSLTRPVLGDAFLLDVDSFTWKKMDGSGSPPTPRHSHSAVTWNGSVIISCGLGDDLRPLNSIHVLDVETLVWEELKVTDDIIPRYSHTSHVIDDQLWLVGGVMPSRHPPVALTIIDLKTGAVQNFSMPSRLDGDVQQCLMLHNHCSLEVPGKNRTICILGGGGNCFSFGTHLNSTPLYLTLD